MQKKHRAKGHSRPVVSKHAVAIKSNSDSTHSNQHQQHSKFGQKPDNDTMNGKASSLGKRKFEKHVQREIRGAQFSQQEDAAASGSLSCRKRQRQQERQNHRQDSQPTQGMQPVQKQQSKQALQVVTSSNQASSTKTKQGAQPQQQQQTPRQQDCAGLQQHTHQPAKRSNLMQGQQQSNPANCKQPSHPHKGSKAAIRQSIAEVDASASQHAAADNGAIENALGNAASAAKMVTKPWRPKQPTAISSNWQALQQQLKQAAATKPRRPHKQSAAAAGSSDKSVKQIASIGHNKAVTPIVAMDCEMVGVGPGGERDSLARVSIVNASGNVLYDSFVAQKEAVTDYRTWVSGVTADHLAGAPDISQVQKEVSELLSGRVLVGHGLKKDLSVLMLSHPRKQIRDTAKYPPFTFSKGGKRRPRALKVLAQQELGISIQEGQHSSVDDARAALYLYQKHSAVWEKALKTPQGLKQLPTANRPLRKKRVDSYSARDLKDDPMADL